MKENEMLSAANDLVTNMGKKPSNQIKHALNYLRRKKDIRVFKSFLNTLHYSDASEKYWKVARGKIEPLSNKYTFEELRYILSWAHRLRKYHYPD